MRERPILFSAPMVRALLAGTKTQTRRVLKPQPRWEATKPMQGTNAGTWWLHISNGAGLNQIGFAGLRDRLPDEYVDALRVRCPYGAPGDRLWVRETWGYDWYDDGQTRAWKRCVYRADPGAQPMDNGEPTSWRPSIHMPRAASRITLEVTGVRVERLQDISDADAQAEGCEPRKPLTASGIVIPWQRSLGYRDLWESINGTGTWDANPWVWVVEFKRVHP